MNTSSRRRLTILLLSLSLWTIAASSSGDELTRGSPGIPDNPAESAGNTLPSAAEDAAASGESGFDVVPADACRPAESAESRTPFIVPGGESKPRFMLSMRTSFVYSVFSPALGFSQRISGYTPVWNTRRATGTFDVGLNLAYAYGSTFLYPWITNTSSSKTTGADHNIRLTAGVGHSFHFGEKRRHTFGIHFLTGVNIAHSEWCVSYAAEGLSGCGTTTFSGLSFGPELEYVYRFSRHVGFHLVLGGSFGARVGGPAGPMLNVGTGLTFFVL